MTTFIDHDGTEWQATVPDFGPFHYMRTPSGIRKYDRERRYVWPKMSALLVDTHSMPNELSIEIVYREAT